MEKQNKSKGKIIISIMAGLVCLILVSLIFIQFKTVEETKDSEIESMREAELKTQISLYKSKFEETSEKLKDNKTKIEEYNQKITQNQESTELLEQELAQSEMILGKTDVIGDGIVLKLKDNYDEKIKSYNILDLINELKFAGAEAVSVNGHRIVTHTEIVDIDTGSGSFILINGQNRIASPYEIKVIGDQEYLSSVLSLKDSGYIDRNPDMDITFEKQTKIEIPKFNGNMESKYIKEEVKK